MSLLIALTCTTSVLYVKKPLWNLMSGVVATYTLNPSGFYWIQSEWWNIAKYIDLFWMKIWNNGRQWRTTGPILIRSGRTANISLPLSLSPSLHFILASFIILSCPIAVRWWHRWALGISESLNKVVWKIGWKHTLSQLLFSCALHVIQLEKERWDVRGQCTWGANRVPKPPRDIKCFITKPGKREPRDCWPVIGWR